MRTEQEIKEAIELVRTDKSLTYGYKGDVIEVLNWVLGGNPFDGIDPEIKGFFNRENGYTKI